MSVKPVLSLLVLAPCFAGAALAAEPATTPQANVQPSDPNEVICEKQEVLGSRLGARKVCKTRAKWAEERLIDQQEVARKQNRRGVSQGD